MNIDVCRRKRYRSEEVMHQILGLKLYRRFFQVVTVSLDNIKRFTLSNHNIQVEKLELETYGGSSVFKEFKDLDLVEFFEGILNPNKAGLFESSFFWGEGGGRGQIDPHFILQYPISV